MVARVGVSLLVGLVCALALILSRDSDNLFLWMIANDMIFWISVLLFILFGTLVFFSYLSFIKIKSRKYSSFELFVFLYISYWCLWQGLTLIMLYYSYSGEPYLLDSRLKTRSSLESILLTLFVSLGSSLLASLTKRYIAIVALVPLVGIYARWLSAEIDLALGYAIALSAFWVIMVYVASWGVLSVYSKSRLADRYKLFPPTPKQPDPKNGVN